MLDNTIQKTYGRHYHLTPTCINQSPRVKAFSQPQIKLPAELSTGFEREFRASMRITKTPNEQAAEVLKTFAQKFAATASNKKQFHKLMQTVYGPDYDKEVAEQYRLKALAGDFSWLPTIKWSDSQTLQDAYGAYDSNANVVYLDQKYASDPEFAAYIYSEEAGHFLDTKLKSQDTIGEEGEIFRRLLAGEQISKSEMANLRALNRDGTITVDGKQVSVEFWSLGGVVKGIKNAAKSVTGAVTDAAKSVTKGVGEAVSGFAGNIVKGKIDAAFTALGHGFDTAVIKSITQLANGLIDTGAEIVNAVVAIKLYNQPLKQLAGSINSQAAW